MRAGHLPTKHFGLAEWQAMPVWVQRQPYEFPPEGFCRSSINGKPIVGYYAPLGSDAVTFAVRPIVRVPMGRVE